MGGLKSWLAQRLLTPSFWDNYARRYDRIEHLLSYRNLQDRVLRSAELIPHVRILDLGCGTGNTLRRLADRAADHTELFGVDRSPLMLERARAKLAGRATIRQHDLNKPLTLAEFGGAPFDRLVSVNSLYAVQDPVAVLRSWYSLLDDGGLLILAHPHRPKIRTWLGEHLVLALKRLDIGALFNTLRLAGFVFSNLLIKWGAQGKVMHFLPPEELKALCRKAGFAILKEDSAYAGGVVILQLQKDTGASVRRAHTFDELNALTAMRYEVYCNEIKSLDPADYPDGRETDSYDEHAVSFLARAGSEYMGTLRLLSSSNGIFLLEDAIRLPAELEKERDRTLEVSRWIVIPRARGTGLWYTLVEEAVRWSRQRGYAHWVAACRDRLWIGLEKRGWSVILWDEYKDYHNTLAAPGELIPPATLYGTVHDNRTRAPGYGIHR